MTTTHIALTVIGGSFDLGGVALVASPDLAPRLQRLETESLQLASRLQVTVSEFMRKLLRRQPQGGRIDVPFIASRTQVYSPGLVSTPPHGADIEEKLSHLITESVRTQHRLIDVEGELVMLRDQAVKQRTEIGNEIEAHVARSGRRYEQQRFWGVVLVALGGLLLAAANLVV